jgi:miniconductance mechanosensitive channel
MEKGTDIQQWVDRILEGIGVSPENARTLDTWIIFAGIILFALFINFILRWGVMNGVKKIVRKTKVKWDDVLFDNNVMTCLCNIVTPIVIAMMLPMAFTASGSDSGWVYQIIL